MKTYLAFVNQQKYLLIIDNVNKFKLLEIEKKGIKYNLRFIFNALIFRYNITGYAIDGLNNDSIKLSDDYNQEILLQFPLK
ncbi:MAG: hypothetical protein U9Q80_05035 [Bacillota bacterium]|nr:hypothetical protein [Bacillota bacterium]